MRDFFEGWYYKQQSAECVMALIPACHRDQNGAAASLQLIIPGQVFCIGFPKEALKIVSRKEPAITLGDNLFSSRGIRLNICTEEVEVVGQLDFGTLTRPEHDVMGPFAFVPFMECRHSVFSMRHDVQGALTLNGRRLDFGGGTGYIEGDRGNSFPKRYLWTHCSTEEASLMLSVADIPFLGGCFTGIISMIVFRGQEFRLATYLGAKVLVVGDGRAEVRQGEYRLKVHLLEDKSQLLAAPVQGSMTRHIHESLACRVSYSFSRGKDVLFDFVTPYASFENEFK